MKIDLNKKEKYWFAGIGLAVLAMPILLTKFSIVPLTTTGQIGDTIGGVTAPFLSFFGAILVYLALKSQIDANREIQIQFKQQQIDNANNFEFEKYKERIYLIIKEVDGFNVSFHKGKLITNLSDLSTVGGKKYNFTGVQGLNLFLIEYFRDRNEKVQTGIGEFDANDSFHSVALNISNLIILFNSTHDSIVGSSLSSEYKDELKKLLDYVYASKINFLVEHYRSNNPPPNIVNTLNNLSKYYSIKIK